MKQLHLIFPMIVVILCAFFAFRTLPNDPQVSSKKSTEDAPDQGQSSRKIIGTEKSDRSTSPIFEDQDVDYFSQKVGNDIYPRSYKLQAKVKYSDILKNLGAALRRGEDIQTFDYPGPDGKLTKVKIAKYGFFDDDPEGVEILGSYADFPESEVLATYSGGYECVSGHLDLETFLAYEPQQDDEHLYVFTYNVNEMIDDLKDSRMLRNMTE